MAQKLSSKTWNTVFLSLPFRLLLFAVVAPAFFNSHSPVTAWHICFRCVFSTWVHIRSGWGRDAIRLARCGILSPF